MDELEFNSFYLTSLFLPCLPLKLLLIPSIFIVNSVDSFIFDLHIYNLLNQEVVVFHTREASQFYLIDF